MSDSKVKKIASPRLLADRRQARAVPPPGIPKRIYETELVRLQEELVKMTEWVKTSGERVVVISKAETQLAKAASSSGSPSI